MEPATTTIEALGWDAGWAATFAPFAASRERYQFDFCAVGDSA